MNASSAIAVNVAGDDSGEGIPCPGCTSAIGEPKSTRYLGLGRIEHVWQCRRCGYAFRTGARMAGLINADPPTSVIVNY